MVAIIDSLVSIHFILLNTLKLENSKLNLEISKKYLKKTTNKVRNTVIIKLMCSS